MMYLLAEFAPRIGLLFFFFFFLYIVFWTMRPSKKEELESYAHIPLMEDE